MVVDDGREMKELLDWLSSKTMNFAKTEPVFSEATGWGLVAAVDCRDGELLLEVPNRLIIRSCLIDKVPAYRDALRKNVGLINSFELLMIFLCYESSLGASSDWAPYIAILPKLSLFSTPVNIVQMQPEMLPDSVRELFRNQRRDLAEMSSRLQTFWSCLCPGTTISSNSILWSWHCVNTRCVFMDNPTCEQLNNTDGDVVALMPYFDLLNHSPYAKTQSTFYRQSQSYRLCTNTSVSKGREIHICYGPHSNARLCVEYGFVLDENPNNSILITNEDLYSYAQQCGCDVNDAHLAALNQAIGLRLYELQCDSNWINWMLMAAIKILTMNEKEIQFWKNTIYKNSDFMEDKSLATLGIRILTLALDELTQKYNDARPTIPPNIKSLSMRKMLYHIWNDDMRTIGNAIRTLDDFVKDKRKTYDDSD